MNICFFAKRKFQFCLKYHNFKNYFTINILATDQYADGRAARVWQMYIGGTSTRTLKYKTFLTDILRRHNCSTVFDVACGTG